MEFSDITIHFNILDAMKHPYENLSNFYDSFFLNEEINQVIYQYVLIAFLCAILSDTCSNVHEHMFGLDWMAKTFILVFEIMTCCHSTDSRL